LKKNGFFSIYSPDFARKFSSNAPKLTFTNLNLEISTMEAVNENKAPVLSTSNKRDNVPKTSKK